MLLNKRIPFSYILNKIKVELIYVLITGLLVHFLTWKFDDYLPVMPLTIPAFLGTAISVILSFKLNQSYDRWWEARKIWGSIVNDSRSFILQLQSFVAKGNEEVIRTLGFRHIGWCFSLGQSLRGLDATENLHRFLSEEDLIHLSKHNNKPLAILQLNSHDIAELRRQDQLEMLAHLQINSTVVNFTNAMGMAERIKSTVFPATYRLFLHLIIYLFVVTLAISLRDTATYFEIPLLLAISSAFFLLEKSATHLQDPFNNRPTDTAMTAIATTIEINIKQLLSEKEVPKPYTPPTFYAM